MPRKVFEGFSILDAEDVNTYLMDQAVMSFAGTAARGSAIPAPTDGMVSWLQDSDTFTIYNGSSWANPTPDPTLVHIATQSFSTVTSTSLNNVFSSTYSDYKVLYNISSASLNDDLIRFRLRASGSDLTTNTYDSGEYYVGVGRTLAAGNINSSLVGYAPFGNTQIGSGLGGEVNLFDPYVASNTKIVQNAAGGSLHFTAVVVLNTSVYDGCTLYALSGNITGTISVFGIRES